MNPPDVVRILGQVPETRLRLIELSWSIAGENGQIKPEAVAFHAKEIEEAAEEAEAYSNNTREIVRCLINMARRTP